MSQNERVAIVGMGGIFPGSTDLEGFWENVAGGVDTTREVPPGRWLLDAEDAFDARVGEADRVYSTRGGFIEGFRLDPEGLDLDVDVDLDRLDPMFHLALHAGRQAWRSAVTDGLDRSRVGVVLGNIVLPTETASALARATLGRTLAERLGVREDDDAKAEQVAPLNAYAAGLPAGLLARALGLGGGSFTLDAACASSLYALKLAADELLSGRADAMLTGGLSRPDPLYTQMGFSQLRALAKSGRPMPFDARGDGLVVGEGAGIVVLKRLSDALRQGDTILGIVAAVGLSNDVDGGLLAPSSEGQLRAMRAAYAQAGWDARAVDLVECHATGTPVGDAVEIASLRALWGPDGWSTGQCAIGSVKSNIGHALTAAGSAGLLKVLFSLREKVLPPTANFRAAGSNIASALAVENGPFRVLTESQPWAAADGGRPRRAAISGFGFGGINAHALIEEWVEPPSEGNLFPSKETGFVPAMPSAPAVPATPVAIVGMAAHFGPYRGLRAFQERVLGGTVPGAGAADAPANWWGAEQTAWFPRRRQGRTDVRAYNIAEVVLPAERFRIPPRELEEMLPQQSLALLAAAEAIADAGWRDDDRKRLRAGVFVGIGLDLNTTNFHVRWSLLPAARRWNQALGLGLEGEAFDAWVRSLRDAAGPALSANRTMGALGGLVASRIAREFRIGGPSFTVSSEETSGVRALEVAVRLLGQREIDEAIVGAVDLACDVRAVLCAEDVHGAVGALPADGAAALVVKRLDDAVRDGDRIYAVVRGLGGSGGSDPRRGERAARRAHDDAGVAPASLGYLEAHASGRSADDRVEAAALAALGRDWPREVPEACALGSARADIGHAGAAAGLASVIKTALCLYQQILPPFRNETLPASAPFFAPRGAQFWLRDRARGPRRAAVSALSTDGNCQHVVLEAFEPQASAATPDRLQPLGARPAALFAVEADDESGLRAGLDALDALAAADPARPIESLARQWWQRRPNAPARRLGLALRAGGVDALQEAIAAARRALEGAAATRGQRYRDAACFLPPSGREPLGTGSERGIAFVFPGLGNGFAGMGRDLSALWPEVLRAQDAETGTLKSQFAPGTYWNSAPPEAPADHRAPILGQVALGSFVSDLLRRFGVAPAAVVGYSLGESAALFALRAWKERDAMLGRIHDSPLFRTELAGPCEAARRAWRLAPGEPADWLAGIIPHGSDTVRAALGGRERVYLLIANTPREVVIGGRREAVLALAADLGGRFFPLPVVSTVHCPVARQVEAAYRAMHLLETTAPPGVRFYSGATGRAYAPDRVSAAESIVAHAIHGIDFPLTVTRAYDDGARIFLEPGPGGSCSRMIDRILGTRPHLARPVCVNGEDALETVLDLLGSLIAERVAVDLAPLYGHSNGAEPAEAAAAAGRTVKAEVGGRPFAVPPLPVAAALPSPRTSRPVLRPAPRVAPQTPTHQVTATVTNVAVAADPLTRQVLATETSKAEAHEAFLRVSGNLGQTMSNQLAFQIALIEALMAEPGEPGDQKPVLLEEAVFLDRDGCLEFAVGKIGTVLGPEFAAIDAHPTRVRLPDEPLMLVDRILTVEGRPRSLEGGRVVTEHDVLPGAWYLDGGRIPTCIAVESGQADLFLSGYLGIDFITRGLAVYRLLDAVVTFHAALPGPGAVIHYDIHIDHFFRQGETHLFRFRFEATVDGMPLLTMSDGCAGFFTESELAAGQGIVAPRVERQARPGGVPDDWEELAPRPVRVETYSDAQVEALRRGDLAGAFGAAFAGLPLHDPVRLPGGRMTLVHRVLALDPTGGKFGLGSIRAEADIHPDDWFMTCHFVDDRVMPGTLMYECCLHTLRIYLMRLGWVGEHDEVACEPVPGVASRLKCRGQVVESTERVTYDVTVKELGYGPEPYAIVDALMSADGKPIVEITDMSLRMSGLSRARLRQLWSDQPAAESAAEVEPPPLFDTDRILAFAVGKPSEAFGERYRVFDAERVIARLPGPPFQFLDRITVIEATPWVLEAGGVIEARYDVPPDAWYFEAERTGRMPFAVLLETALQPCGWLAAYLGSALSSADDLKFRNLGGSAVQLVEITPEMGTLTTEVRITKVAQSGGMILETFEMAMRAGDRPVYRGDTYFGFFRAEALAEQVGLRDAALYRPNAAEQARARAFDYPEGGAFPAGRLRMIDRVDTFIPDGGPHGLGFIEGSQDVDASAWYFKAHFHQDPVCPGSLGLESFRQLLKVVAAERWGDAAAQGASFSAADPDVPHRWTYRGQVLPTAGRVVVQATITAVDDHRRRLRADGFLTVDGRTIFQMNDFTLGLD